VPSSISPGAGSGPRTIFHEHWWLDAAAGDRWHEVRVETGSGQIACLPVFRTTKRGLPMLGMPPLTHILGPQFEGIDGKPEAQRRMRLALTDQLIAKLPRHIIFNQTFHEVSDFGLAWRLNGYSTSLEYNFVLEDCSNLAAIKAGMRDTTRRVLRRAQEKLVVEMNSISPVEFVDFYFSNLAARGRPPNFARDIYLRVIETAIKHEAAQIISAKSPDGTLLASTFTIFDSRTTYYLLTTHRRVEQDNGSVALLIWNAIEQASKRGQAFDFDGFGDRGTAVFLNQFGGELRWVLRVTRMPKILQGILHLGARFSPKMRD
jgi:hypothetical protein